MATFKVGQRVRIVSSRHGWKVGKTGTIHAPAIVQDCPHDYHWAIDIDGEGTGGFPRSGYHGCWESQLRPLTDPKAEAFLESLKKLGREPSNMPLPLPEKALVHIKGGA